MNRHFYISNNLDDLELLEVQLETVGISAAHSHVLSLDDADVAARGIEPEIQSGAVRLDLRNLGGQRAQPVDDGGLLLRGGVVLELEHHHVDVRWHLWRSGREPGGAAAPSARSSWSRGRDHSDLLPLRSRP